MKLSEELELWHCDRPDEWKMDEFRRKAEKLEAERDALAGKLAQKQQLISEMDQLCLTVAEFNEIRAGAVIMFAHALASLFPHGMSGGDVFAQAERSVLRIRQGGDV